MQGPRSQTPNADMERSVYGADCSSTPTYLNKVPAPAPAVLPQAHFVCRVFPLPGRHINSMSHNH